VIGAAVMVAKIGPRLYDTQAACYVTLGNLQSWAAKGIAFVVIDAYAPIRECV
jgi:polyhydroxyalkanoate synthesis regulator protein